MSNSVISRDPDVMGGTPVFAGTRVPVQTLVDYLEAGETVESFLEGFPTVTREQLLSFLNDANGVGKMDALDVQDRLEYARAGVAVLRALKIKDETMRYKDFGIAIGLISDDEKWGPWHRQQVADILNIIAATERTVEKMSRTAPAEIERIVNESGEPGAGFEKKSRIVRE